MRKIERLRRELDRLQNLRFRAEKLSLGFQVQQADARIADVLAQIERETR